jgi:hypothetical protein
MKAHYIFTDRTDTIRVTGDRDKAIKENKDGFVEIKCHLHDKIFTKDRKLFAKIECRYIEYSSTGIAEREISKEDIIDDLKETLTEK